jgi:hypothetical protein
MTARLRSCARPLSAERPRHWRPGSPSCPPQEAPMAALRHAPPRVSQPAVWSRRPRSSRPPTAGQRRHPPRLAMRRHQHVHVQVRDCARDHRQKRHTSGGSPPDPSIWPPAHDRPPGANSPVSTHWLFGAIPPRTPDDHRLTWAFAVSRSCAAHETAGRELGDSTRLEPGARRALERVSAGAAGDTSA